MLESCLRRVFCATHKHTPARLCPHWDKLTSNLLRSALPREVRMVISLESGIVNNLRRDGFETSRRPWVETSRGGSHSLHEVDASILDNGGAICVPSASPTAYSHRSFSNKGWTPRSWCHYRSLSATSSLFLSHCRHEGLQLASRVLVVVGEQRHKTFAEGGYNSPFDLWGGSKQE